ncbi:hypothetical protein [Methylorubrum zatmanii]|uniref:ABC transporter permease n=1 Tax=Methylorubrum zatmanii TaxID=29429 RepID=A0ABW1WHW8_9HYPH|nr:hypothetical protein [Methylorubrum zatmanii]MBD8905777.1 hypothetical protein [Methylorubrum zatmanii]
MTVLQAYSASPVLRPAQGASFSARPAPAAIVTDGYRYRSIRSGRAIALAIVAAAVTPALVWLAL